MITIKMKQTLRTMISKIIATKKHRVKQKAIVASPVLQYIWEVAYWFSCVAMVQEHLVPGSVIDTQADKTGR